MDKCMSQKRFHYVFVHAEGRLMCRFHWLCLFLITKSCVLLPMSLPVKFRPRRSQTENNPQLFSSHAATFPNLQKLQIREGGGGYALERSVTQQSDLRISLQLRHLSMMQYIAKWLRDFSHIDCAGCLALTRATIDEIMDAVERLNILAATTYKSVDAVPIIAFIPIHAVIRILLDKP